MKKSDITKQKILKAAEKAFAQKGLYGARVDEISEASETNKRMIYAYFGNKEGLYLAVLESVYSKMADSESKLLEKEVDCKESIQKVIYHYFSFLYENPEFVKIVMWENLNEASFFEHSDAAKIKGSALELLEKKLKQGQEQGIFRENLDIKETAMTINMLCFSHFSNIHTMAQIMNVNYSDKKEITKRRDYVVEMVMNHILAEG